MTAPHGGDLISVGRAAKLAGKSERQLWRLVASGQLVSVMVGGHRRVRRADIAATAKKTLTSGEKKTDMDWKCQSVSRHCEVVTEILHDLQPIVEKLVRKHLAAK